MFLFTFEVINADVPPHSHIVCMLCACIGMGGVGEAMGLHYLGIRTGGNHAAHYLCHIQHLLAGAQLHQQYSEGISLSHGSLCCCFH